MTRNIKLNKGFTIVELLVVIVVIGILAAITMVSYTGVTDKANLAANQSNASSIQQAADTYYAENQVYPTAAQINGGIVKVPASLVSKITDDAPAAINPDLITYEQASTGYCIQYWNTVTKAIATLASAGTGATCN